MPTTSILTAGNVPGTAIWQSVGTTTAGDWADPAHWVGGTLGGAGLVVALGPGDIWPYPAFVISASNPAALDLTVDLAIPAGTLAVSDTLSVLSGTLDLSGASLVTATTLELLAASVLSLDATGMVEVGTSQGVAGAVAIGAGRS